MPIVSLPLDHLDFIVVNSFSPFWTLENKLAHGVLCCASAI